MKRTVLLLITLALLAGALACTALTTPVTPSETTSTSPELQKLVQEEVARQLATRMPVTYGSALLDGDLQTTLIQLYARVNPAVVYIITDVGSGSGFVYDTEGHIVTNNHVVANSSQYEVVFSDGTRQAGTLVGADADSDLAVLKVDQLPAGVTPLPLAEQDVQVGQFVVAIGNPFGEQGSMTFGIVSGLGRSLPSQRTALGGSTYVLPMVIQTDAPINPGNSGGPLVNLAGEVVGINAAIATLTGTGSGVGYSIPALAVKRIVPALIQEGKYTYPYMGVLFDGDLSLEDMQTYGLTQTAGAYVLSVTAGSPAEKAGLRGTDPVTRRGGDLVIALDDVQVRNFGDLNAYLVFHCSVGQTVQVTVIRDGKTVTLPLKLGARP